MQKGASNSRHSIQPVDRSLLQKYEDVLVPTSIGYRYVRLVTLQTQAINAVLEPYGITRNHWVVLCRLWHTDGLPVIQIANDIQLIGGTVTGVLDRMTRRKLIYREHDSKDRRVSRVFLHPDGNSLRSVLPPLVLQAVQKMLASVSKEEQLSFSCTINKMIENFGSSELSAESPIAADVSEPCKEIMSPGALTHRMKVLRFAWRRYFSDRLSVHEITPFQWCVLCCLWRENGIPTQKVGHVVDQAGGTLAGLLERMQERGLLRREQDKDDRRISRIWLEEKGAEMLAVLPPIAAATTEQAFHGIDTTARTNFESILLA